jgi:uncharacterized protein (DUF2342 family)
VVDVGINVVDGTLVGDVDFDSARRVASAITPVPGGIGPLTNALLLAHLVRAANGQADAATPTASGSTAATRGAPSSGSSSVPDRGPRRPPTDAPATVGDPVASPATRGTR